VRIVQTPPRGENRVGVAHLVGPRRAAELDEERVGPPTDLEIVHGGIFARPAAFAGS
jgi:hypothetical protein